MTRPSHSRDDSRPGYCQCGNEYPCQIVDRAQAAAERIVAERLGEDPPGSYDWQVLYRDARKAPTAVGEVREALLAGYAFISWMRDDPRG